ncbi:MAG: diaminopimelate epimerase [Thermodesulfovibrionales bacterium]
MTFTKMHGLGNDFILIDCLNNKFKIQDSKFKILAKNLCHRRFGIGADQLLLLCSSKIADYRMRIFNADGSEVEMCGNGIRCIAKYIWGKGLSDKNVLNIETLAGIIKPEKAGDMIKVDMGEPVFEPDKIPVNIVINESRAKDRIIDYPLKIEDKVFSITCLSMGNPHAVIFVKGISDFPVSFCGPLIQNNPIFPKRTNVEFVEVINKDEVKVRVWERGAGETMACGTGASAVAVAANTEGFTNRALTVHLTGGDLFIEWAEDNHVYMTGPAVKVFEGIIEIN